MMTGLTTPAAVLDAVEHWQSLVQIAADFLRAKPAGDIPGLWNVPGHPELTSGQLLDLWRRRESR